MNYQSLKQRIYGGDNIVSLSDVRYLPRWVILLIDIFLLILSIRFSYFILEMLNVNPLYVISQLQKYLIVILLNMVFMYVFKTYSGVIRHSSFIDLSKLLLASFCTLLSLSAINTGIYWISGSLIFRTPLLVIYFAISFMMLFLFRLFVKEFFYIIKEYRRSALKKRILVLGIDDQAIAIARVVLDNPNLPYQIMGFLTQRSDSKRAKLLGKPIFLKDKIERYSKKELGLDGVLIIKEVMSKEDMNCWVNLFLEKDLRVFTAPTLQKLRNEDLIGTIKTLQIEDLLKRKPIKIDSDEVKEKHFGKTILITGGAGSIGSEIVRQVSLFNPDLIVVLDQAETPLYEIEMEMRALLPHFAFKFVLAEISNRHRIEPLFQKYQFSMVYHAAAYKHVPLIEENPHEAILVNILGTKNLSLLASKYKISRFVMISTDKAVKPTNVMGASKRAAELFVQALQNTEHNETKFITTRFGNVLGSNGSVIPHFKKQIEGGGPVTITHPDITRYFMTIPEACELVLHAATMGKGGEIFVFDMGEPIKILELAKRMIKLSGFNADTDIKIVFTGLRPGEKLYEELLSDGAKTLPTHHEKIMISKDPDMEFQEIEKYCNQIIKAALRREKVDVVTLLKLMIPEFKSNNSIYELLDK